MSDPLFRTYSVVSRGGLGLACDDNGLALGPVTLAKAVRDAAGERRYRLRPLEDIVQALRLAYGPTQDQLVERRCRGLARVTQLLAAGEDAQARIYAVLLAFPEITPEGMAKLASATSLQKDNQGWEDEPRIPAGNPDGGQWTGGEGDDAVVKPPAAPGYATVASNQNSRTARLSYEQIRDLVAGNNNSGQRDEMIIAIAYRESRFNPNAQNHSSTAGGLLGLTSPAIQDLREHVPEYADVDVDKYDPVQNIEAGSQYLALRIDRAGGDVARALAGYGTGPGYATSILDATAALEADPVDAMQVLQDIFGA